MQHRRHCFHLWHEEQETLQAVGVTFTCHSIEVNRLHDRTLEPENL